MITDRHVVFKKKLLSYKSKKKHQQYIGTVVYN